MCEETMKCFDDTALHFMQSGHLSDNNIVVCHAIVEAGMPGNSGTTGHAWIEFTNAKGKRLAVDPAAKIVGDASTYRKQINPRNLIEYSPELFLSKWWTTGYPGPWDLEIKKYTKDKK